MTWTSTTLAWPPSTASIETTAANTLAAIPGAHNNALSALGVASAAVVFNRHPLSSEAAALHGLRTQLDQLLIDGYRLTVTPYDYGVGKVEQTGHYLAPQNAAERLAAKLSDIPDLNRPTGSLYAVGLLVTAGTLPQFAQALKDITRALPLPELAVCARRVHAELSHQQDRMQVAAKAISPSWVPGRHNAGPQRVAISALGAQLAQLESLAADAQAPAAKLAALAAKRDTFLATQTQTLSNLKAGLSGTLYRVAATGTPSAIATALLSGLPSYEQPHSAAVLLVSSQPLTFFQELLP